MLPEIRQVGQNHPAVTSALPGVQVVDQTVESFTVLPGIVQAGVNAGDPGRADLVAEAGFAPIRRGRAVVAQRRAPGGSWEQIAKATQGAEGKARFRIPQDAGTPYQFRVVTTPYHGAPQDGLGGAGVEPVATQLRRRLRQRGRSRHVVHAPDRALAHLEPHLRQGRPSMVARVRVSPTSRSPVTRPTRSGPASGRTPPPGPVARPTTSSTPTSARRAPTPSATAWPPPG